MFAEFNEDRIREEKKSSKSISKTDIYNDKYIIN